MTRIGSEFDVLREDQAVITLNEKSADFLATRMAHRFHAIAQKLKGGTLAGPEGRLGPDPKTQNQWGGKGVIKFNPTNNEIVQGIKSEISLFSWQSPDGLPHFVTVDIGRYTAGVGGPGNDGTKGGGATVLSVTNPRPVIGAVSGATWPAAADQNGNPLYYRAIAQVLLGTPGTMQDPFYIDINRGQRFSTLASYVDVTAQMNGPPIDEATGNVIIPANFTTPFVSGSLAVYATLGMGVAPPLAPVLYTQYIDNQVAVTNTFIRAVPERANFLFPVLLQGIGDTLKLVFINNVGSTVGAIVDPAFGTTPVSVPPIPLPEDCYGVSVLVTAGTNYRLVYQLSV
jgi:hypothetical protein